MGHPWHPKDANTDSERAADEESSSMTELEIPPKNGDYRYHCECGSMVNEHGAIEHTIEGHQGILEIFAMGRWRKSGVRWGDYE